jgi:hypothetical protein
MAFQLHFCSRRDYQISNLPREETAQPAHALDLANLIGDPVLQLLIELIQVIEQPRVLDRDDGLGGETLHKRNLPMRK